MKKILTTGFLLAILVVPFYFINAADYLPKNADDSGNITVSGQEGLKNLYVGGEVVTINQKVLGDLFSFGSTLIVSGEVENDLFALGGNINITSPILEDARMAGGSVIINAPITGDLLVAGGTVSLGGNSEVGGDLWAAGGVVNIASPVSGNVKIYAGEVFINSVIKGTLEINATDKLTFGPQSVVLGNIIYSGKKEPVIQNGAQIGSIEKKIAKRDIEEKEYAGLLIVFPLFKFIMMLIASWVLFRLFRKRITSFTMYSLESANKFWSNAGVGILAMILIPIVILILMISLIGFYLGVTLLIGSIFLAILGCMLSLLTLGQIIENFLQKKNWLIALTNWNSSLKIPLIGSLAMILLSLIPFFGGLILFIIYLATFGNMLKHIRNKLE